MIECECTVIFAHIFALICTYICTNVQKLSELQTYTLVVFVSKFVICIEFQESYIYFQYVQINYECLSKKVTLRNPQKCRPHHGGWFRGFRGSQSAPKPHQWTQILQVSCNANCICICTCICTCICIASTDANTPGELCCNLIFDL